MSTDHPVDALSAYLDGELLPLERSQIETHVAGCIACGERLAELAAVDALAREMPVVAPPGYFEALPGRIRARVPARRRPAIPAWAMLVAASLLVAVIAPLVLEQRKERSAPLPAAVPAPATAPSSTAKDLAAERAPAAPPAPAMQQQALTAAAAGGSASNGSVAKPRPEQEAAKRRQAPAAEPAADAAPAEVLAETSAVEARRDEESVGKAVGTVAPPRREAFASPPATRQAEADKVQELADRAEDRRNAPPPAPQAAAAAGAPATALRKAAEEKQAPRGRSADAAPDLGLTGAGATSRAPRTAEQARASRDEWRRVAADLGEAKGGDDARVAVIEMGALAWRLGHEPDDLALVRADAQAYLARADARQADRVRSRVHSLDAAPSPR